MSWKTKVQGRKECPTGTLEEPQGAEIHNPSVLLSLPATEKSLIGKFVTNSPDSYNV